MKRPNYISRYVVLLQVLLVSALLAIAGCNSGTSNHQRSVSSADSASKQSGSALPDSVIRILINASATDFYNHQKPFPAEFREMKIGYLTKQDGTKNYVLCGQFTTKQNPENGDWTYFATIKTSDYEQWLGSNAKSYCEDSRIIFDDSGYLSATLKSYLNKLGSSL